MTPRELDIKDLGKTFDVRGTHVTFRAPIPPRAPATRETPPSASQKGNQSPAAASSPRTSPAGQHAPAAQHQRQRNGKIGEEIAQILHDICRREKVAEVEKVATPMVIRGNDPRPPEKREDGVFLAKFGAKAGVDYRGWLEDGSGRAVLVECKFVEEADGAFPLSKMRPVQRAQLDAATKARCVTVLIVVRGPRRETFAIPWAVVQKHETNGVRSLGTRELAGWKVHAGSAYLAHFCTRRIGR